MRIKQLVMLVLLIFANIFLLAHTVLPHAHHDGIVCFSLEELMHQNHCSDHHDNICDCCCEYGDKRHHHHTDTENCELKNIVLRQQDSFHEDIIPCENCLSLLYTLYTLNEYYFDTTEYGLRLQEKPYIDNYISPFVGSVKSLRAPPASYFLG